MNTRRFDALAKALAPTQTRRALLGAATLAAPFGTSAAVTAAACRPPGAKCRRNRDCCAKACLDNGRCGCFNAAGNIQVPCPGGCRCDQVLPGGVGACVVDVNYETCCDTLPVCESNRDCGRSGFCDVSVCNASVTAVCARACPA
jgi:hypothetical protein